MLRYLLIFIMLAATGCTSTPNLPPTDTILKVKLINSGIIANSDKYSYRFFGDGTTQEYQRYYLFFQRFQENATGIKVNFVVEKHQVIAEYIVVFDRQKLNELQLSQLEHEYKSFPLDNKYVGVLFKTSGYWSKVNLNELDDSYLLPNPIVVAINDKTQTVNELLLLPLIPVFPLIMMYGCATGPCI